MLVDVPRLVTVLIAIRRKFFTVTIDYFLVFNLNISRRYAAFVSLKMTVLIRAVGFSFSIRGFPLPSAVEVFHTRNPNSI